MQRAWLPRPQARSQSFRTSLPVCQRMRPQCPLQKRTLPQRRLEQALQLPLRPLPALSRQLWTRLAGRGWCKSRGDRVLAELRTSSSELNAVAGAAAPAAGAAAADASKAKTEKVYAVAAAAAPGAGPPAVDTASWQGLGREPR